MQAGLFDLFERMARLLAVVVAVVVANGTGLDFGDIWTCHGDGVSNAESVPLCHSTLPLEMDVVGYQTYHRHPLSSHWRTAESFFPGIVTYDWTEGPPDNVRLLSAFWPYGRQLGQIHVLFCH